MITGELFRKKHIRDDGWLAEVISMNYQDHPFHGVHTYIVSIVPGRSRANHFHAKKEEWIGLASGKIQLILEDTRTHMKESLMLDSSSEEYRVIHIPSLIAHSLRNIGTGEASVVVFSTTPEDPDDTIPFQISE